VSAQGQKTGATARTANPRKRAKKWCNEKTNMFKFESCGSFGLIPKEKGNLQISK
jgi:hypothetical protein